MATSWRQLCGEPKPQAEARLDRLSERLAPAQGERRIQNKNSGSKSAIGQLAYNHISPDAGFVMAIQHEIEGEGFTHQYLWNCATTLLTQPETKSPKDLYFQMAGMVMAYFAYEAYLNLVGRRIEPSAWQNERDFFSRHPYRGTEGKLKLLCDKCGIEVDRNNRPYVTIRELRRLRDYLAHGKPDIYAFEVDGEEGKEPDMFPLEIHRIVTRETADRALHDTEEFIEYLHALISSQSKNSDGVLFRGKALQFPLAWASGGPKRST